MQSAPLDMPEALLPLTLQKIVRKDTPIPTIAIQAVEKSRSFPGLVRADIGQISALEPSLEVLYGTPVGLEPLREVLAETFNRAVGWKERNLPVLPEGLTAKHVAITTGAAEGLSILFRCFAQGKVVGLPRGHWESYTNGVELAGGTPVLIDYFNDEGRLDIYGLYRQIQEHGIGLLVINFPCNPTGAVLDEEETQALGQLLIHTGLVAIADEVYYRLRFDGHPPTSLLTAAPGHVVSVISASKEYLIPGARVGYVLSTQADLTDRILRRLIRAESGSPNVLGQQRLLSLMRPDLEDLRAGRPPGLLERIRVELGKRKAALVEVLRRHALDPVGRPKHDPQGTIFLMARVPSYWLGDDVHFARALLDAGVVSVVPGSAFALPNTVRFSFGGLDEAAIVRLEANLRAFEHATLGEGQGSP